MKAIAERSSAVKTVAPAPCAEYAQPRLSKREAENRRPPVKKRVSIGLLLVLLMVAAEPTGRSSSGQSGIPALQGVPPVTAPPEAFFEKVREADREVARRFYKKYIDVKG